MMAYRRTAAGARQSHVRLVVEKRGSDPEVVTTVGPANERMVQELGGLDSDSLLNSCFVQQKKLDRLEQLGRQPLVASLLTKDQLSSLRINSRSGPDMKETIRRSPSKGPGQYQAQHPPRWWALR